MFQLVAEFPLGTKDNSCLTCKSDRRPTDRLIDLGIVMDEILDLDGNNYGSQGGVMCETCLKELAHMLGWITDDVSAKMEELRADNRALKQRLADYKDFDKQLGQWASSRG